MAWPWAPAPPLNSARAATEYALARERRQGAGYRHEHHDGGTRGGGEELRHVGARVTCTGSSALLREATARQRCPKGGSFTRTSPPSKQASGFEPRSLPRKQDASSPYSCCSGVKRSDSVIRPPICYRIPRDPRIQARRIARVRHFPAPMKYPPNVVTGQIEEVDLESLTAPIRHPPRYGGNAPPILDKNGTIDSYEADDNTISGVRREGAMWDGFRSWSPVTVRRERK